MALVPHQGLGARTRWVHAPGLHTAAPNFKNCRTVETIIYRICFDAEPEARFMR